jgi:hypothetical protein
MLDESDAFSVELKAGLRTARGQGKQTELGLISRHNRKLGSVAADAK